MAGIDPLFRALNAQMKRLPAPALRALAGRPRVNDRGDTHDLIVQAGLISARRLGIHFQTDDVARGRAAIRRSTRLGCRWPATPPAAADLTLPCGLRARRYLPAGGAPRALMVWFHGGGWVVGDLDTADSACQWLAAHAGLAVLSVDYRLAPEHPWPGPRDDAEAAWRDARARADTWGLGGLPVGVGGDSAGGNLSAALSLRLRGAPEAPAFQVLVYPAVDLRRQAPSHALFAGDLTLPVATIKRCLEHYAPDIEHPDASPALADSLEGLPSAVVATCGFDPLRDEGEAYAAALREAGVMVREVRAPTLPHGFLHMDGMCPAAARAVDDLVGAVGALLTSL